MSKLFRLIKIGKTIKFQLLFYKFFVEVTIYLYTCSVDNNSSTPNLD